MQLRGTNLVFDTASYKRPVISGSGSGTSFTLNEYQSGSVVLLDKPTGSIWTLPDARPGINFIFVSTVNLTAASYTIKANAASSSYAIVGAISNMNSSSTVANTFTADITGAKTYQQVALNSGTTGGRIGSAVEVTALSSGTWYVTGLVVGTSTTATPFLA